ncbi:thioredoxin family protein [Flavobacterium hibernum]|uniref:Thioredoxin n=1 Tax=Flavobacterium hibernum TaxID=37752 RepID=A0A0D0EEJ4_9FLAO|nr:thioredoxin family protein [Flavobacterium hibernum]KIO52459.1 thioredoxin [Flavobacterium hibernum]OXA86671.1 thioredoxin [Flavobacterium hibernum]STO18781.1 thiol:disulfide interchange protein precursor [Flavobacterium hibernum]
MRFIYTLVLFISLQIVNSQNQFVPDNVPYKTALENAKSQGKPLFVMLYADWCPHCNLMKKEVFSDSNVMDFLKKNYVCTWKDIEKEEGITLKNKFNTKSLPTFLFIDPNDETLLYALKGELKKADFLAEANYALNPTMQLPYLEKQFLADPSNSDKYFTYLNTLKKGKDRTDLSVPTHIYLNTQSDAQLLSETNWRVIANGVTDIKSREFQYVLNHQKEFAAVASQNRVDRKIESIVNEMLRPLVDNLDTINYYKQREIAKSIRLQKTDSLVFKFDLTLAERTEKWQFYKKVTLDDTQKLVWNDASFLKEIGQTYLKHISDTESLKKSISWVKHSLELNDSYDGNLLLARLYNKIKDKKLALQYAKDAKDISKEMNWDAKEVDSLLAELNKK